MNEKTMTIKEIAELINRTEKTVRKWISQDQKVLTKEQKVLTKGHSKKYDLASVIAILKCGKISDSLISLLIENANKNLPQKKDNTVENMFIAFMNQQQKTNELLISMIQNEKKQNKTLLPAKEKSDRDNLRQIINSYVVKKNISHRNAWNILYEEVYYRMNINIRLRAENRDMQKLDYAEMEGYLPDLLAIAIEIFN